MKTKLYHARFILLLALACFGSTYSSQATHYTFLQMFSGTQEVPPNASPGQGVIVGTYNDVTNTLAYGIRFSDLTSNTTMGHFHGPALPGQGAGVVLPFDEFPTGVTSGEYTRMQVITDAQETQLLSGLWYANIHTTNFPGGELRAQVVLEALPATSYPFFNQYSGSQEVPPNASPAQGIIVGTYDVSTNMLTYALAFRGLTSGTTASHFHGPAPMGVSAGVLIPKPDFPVGVMSGQYYNTHTLTEMQEGQLLAGLWYSNIHTSTYPGGELRAQIMIDVPPVTGCTAPTFLNTLPIVGDATCGLSDGQISIIPTSGTAPFMYSLNGGTDYVMGPDVGYTKFELPAGTYQLKLKDANGCEFETIERMIKEINCPAGPDCTAPTFLNTMPIVGDATCEMSDGQISIIPLTGTAPFMYSIDNGATYMEGPDAGYTFFNLPAGTYQLMLKDANGCVSEMVERMVKSVNCATNCTTVPTFLNTMPIVGDATCGMSDGQISIIPTSGTGPFMYSINGGTTYVSGPNTGYTFFNLPAGTYQLKMMQMNGCESEMVERMVGSINCPMSGRAINTRRSPLSLFGAMEKKEVIATFPNPSNGQFTMQLKNFRSPKAEVSVFDAKGTLVQKRSINPNKVNTTSFNLSGFGAGMYYIKVVSENGTTTSKVLVQK